MVPSFARTALPLLAAALCAASAQAGLHVVQALDLGDTVLLRSQARELFLGRAGQPIARVGRLPEGSSRLVSDGASAFSVAPAEKRGRVVVSWLVPVPEGSRFDRLTVDVPPTMQASDVLAPRAVDLGSVYFEGGSRWDRAQQAFVPGHVPEHPDLEVVDASTEGAATVRLCRDVAAPEGAAARLWLVTGDGVRERVGIATGSDRLATDATHAYVLHEGGAMVRYELPSLSARTDLAPMLPPGTLRFFSADDASYWLEVEHEGEAAVWRVDRETLDFERVDLSALSRRLRAVADTGAELWFAQPGGSDRIALVSAPKSGGGVQAYRAQSRHERRSGAFWRGVGDAFLVTGAIVAFPVVLPIAMIASGE